METWAIILGMNPDTSPETDSSIKPSVKRFLVMMLAVVLAAGCSTTQTGIRSVAPTEAATIQTESPADLVVLDVRTLEEFSAGHLEGAEMLDFYRTDFPDRLAELDKDVPYIVYCRSGNRSGQTVELMDELGFTNVTEVTGGIVAWSESGLPLVR